MSNRRFLTVAILWGTALRLLVWQIQRGTFAVPEVLSTLELVTYRLKGIGVPLVDPHLTSTALTMMYAAIVMWLEQLGLVGWQIQRVVSLHNALLSVLVIPAIYRTYATLSKSDPADTIGGRLVVYLAVLYPTLLYFAPHLYVVAPALVALAWTYALGVPLFGSTSFTAKNALKFGLMAGLTLVLDVYTLPWIAVLLIAALFSTRWYYTLLSIAVGVCTVTLFKLGESSAGLHVPVLPVSMTVEVAHTFHSIAANLKQSLHWWWVYTGVSGMLMLFVSMASVKRDVLRIQALALVPLAFATTEVTLDRTLYSFLMLACGACLNIENYVANLKSNESITQRKRVAVGGFCAVLALNLLLIWQKDWQSHNGGMFPAQRYVARFSDVRGVIAGTSVRDTGGYTMFDKSVPLAREANWELMHHRLFNYMIVRDDSAEASRSMEAGFTPIRAFRNYLVFKRMPPAQQSVASNAPDSTQPHHPDLEKPSL
jgi:hypothetical protein